MIAEVKEIVLIGCAPQPARVNAEPVQQAIGIARQARLAGDGNARQALAKGGTAAPGRQARRIFPEVRQEHFGAQVHARPLLFRKIGEYGQTNRA